MYVKGEWKEMTAEAERILPDDDRRAPSPDSGTLGKAMAVLDIIASSREPMRFTDILRKLEQPRGTLHRQLSNLVAEGLIGLNPDHSYSLGLRTLKFASQAWSSNSFRTVSEPHIKWLHEQTGETVHLGVLHDLDVIYLDKVEGNQTVRMHSQIGNASPPYCTGVGKAALSALPRERTAGLVGRLEFRRHTENTLADADALLKEIAGIRKAGYAFDREEHEIGIRCVAAPVHSPDGGFVGGVSVTGPAFRLTYENLSNWSSLVCKAARSIMEDMEWRLGPRA